MSLSLSLSFTLGNAVLNQGGALLPGQAYLRDARGIVMTDARGRAIVIRIK